LASHFKNNIQIISFDLDDTLWDNQIVISRAKTKLYEKIIENYPKVAKKFNFAAFDALAGELLQREKYKCNWHALRLLHISEVLQQSGYATIHALALADYYYFWRNRVALFPQVEVVLSYLATRYQLISLSNGNASVNEIGIGQYFQFCICAADVGEKKPSQKIYLEAIKKSNVPANNIVHIGNHLREDVDAALASGMEAIWFNPAKTRLPKNYAVKSLLQIQRIDQLLDIF